MKEVLVKKLTHTHTHWYEPYLIYIHTHTHTHTHTVFACIGNPCHSSSSSPVACIIRIMDLLVIMNKKCVCVRTREKKRVCGKMNGRGSGNASVISQERRKTLCMADVCTLKQLKRERESMSHPAYD